MQLDEFRQMVAQAAALRRRQRLQPAGGPGDKLFPPTYPGESGPTHVFERRRIDGAERVCASMKRRSTPHGRQVSRRTPSPRS